MQTNNQQIKPPWSNNSIERSISLSPSITPSSFTSLPSNITMPSDAFEHIRLLCNHAHDVDEQELKHQLKAILSSNPDVLNELGGGGYSFLHEAVRYRCVEFVKILVEKHEGLVKMAIILE